MQRSILKKRIRARLSSTAIVIRAYANQVFTDNGFEITPEQYTILSLIADNKELYQRQLSEITLKDRANISRIIKILEDKGLVERVTSSNGRQIFKVKATEKGILLHKKIEPIGEKIRNMTINGLSDNELESFLNTLDKMFLNIREKVNLQI